MSGIALLVDRDGGSPDGFAFAQILSALAQRGPDGSDFRRLPSALLGHQHSWVTPEEVGERQPLASRDGRLHLAFDGRIDNRRELAITLGLGEAETAGTSDAALFLRAYESLGAAAFPRVIGPFAAAILDSRSGRVVLVRDAVGDRTIFYWTDGHRFVAGSEECAVLAAPAVPRDLDDERLVAFLGLEEPRPGATFFRSVREVPPAHALTLEGAKLQLARTWAPNLPRRRPRLGDEEWARLLRVQLDEAVASRLRCVGRPAVLLSGGLDSAPMTALAARRLAPARLLAISWVFDELRQSDERRFIDPIVEAYDLDPLPLVCDDALPLGNLDRWPFNPNIPEEALYRGLLERGYQGAHDAGVRTVLSGHLGDQLFTEDLGWLVDLIREGRFVDAWRGLRPLAPTHGWPALLRRWLVRPLVPERLVRKLRPQSRAWLQPDAESLLARSRPPDAPPGVRRARQYVALLGAWTSHVMSAETRLMSRWTVDLRYPFHDRRLVELFLSLPAHQLRRGELTRPIVRNAFEGWLPESVLGRRDKGTFFPLYEKALAGRPADTLSGLLSPEGTLWPRFVREEWVAKAPPGRRGDQVEELVLWSCACLELWRRRMLDSASGRGSLGER